MPAKIDDQTREAVLTAVRAGDRSQRSIATEFGVSATTVRTIAKDAGIINPFDRTATEKATAASASDKKRRRSDLANRLLVLAEASIEQAVAGLDGVGPRDAAIIAGVAIDKHLKLVESDREDATQSVLDRWLVHMVGGRSE